MISEVIYCRKVILDDDHTYTVDGIVTPGVSEILRAGGFGDPAQTASGFVIADEVIDNAADRGVVIARAIELLNAGELDEESLDEEIAPYVDAYRKWCEATGFVAVAQEELIYSHQHGYCGRLDIRGYDGKNRETIIDIKTGSAGLKPWHKYQLAAYAAPFKEGQQWPERIMLHLKSNGKAKAHYFSPKTAAADFRVFLACLTLWHAKAGA